jgi:2-polyprenyl-6-methoxyphenol hydroxylase-like FAD-dependent oxidoreductase
MRIACVGGGAAGLYFSLLMKLRDPGCDITVFERNKEGSASGWGVTFGAHLLQEFYSNDPESAREINKAAIWWREQVIYIRGEKVPYSGSEVYNISRQRMLEILSARAQDLGVCVKYGHEVLSPSELPDADLIVAADGVNSRIRQAAGGFGSHSDSGRNKYIWLGADKAFNEFNFIFVLTDCGWIWAYAYGISTESSTFIVECEQQAWAGLGFDAMPIDEALGVLEKLFSDQLDGHRLIGQLDGGKARWLNFNTLTNDSWNSGRVVLIGDSAHTAHFSIGMGTTLAAGDARVLADQLVQGNLPSALRAYERQRKEDLLPVLAEARCSARWFENLPRYIDLKPEQFGALLYARRTALLAQMPPIAAYTLVRTARSIPVVYKFRRRIGTFGARLAKEKV